MNTVRWCRIGGSFGAAMSNRAPGPLGLVQDFVNTHELDPDREAVGTPEALSAWLDERGLLTGERAGALDHERPAHLPDPPPPLPPPTTPRPTPHPDPP